METIISKSVKFFCVLVSVSLLDEKAVTYAHTMTDCLGSGIIYPIMLSGCSSGVCVSLQLKGNQVWWSSCWDADQGQKQNTEEIGSSKEHVHMITWLPNVSLYLFVIWKERRIIKVGWFCSHSLSTRVFVLQATVWSECETRRRNKNTFKTIINKCHFESQHKIIL